jgi:hypothetical protein
MPDGSYDQATSYLSLNKLFKTKKDVYLNTSCSYLFDNARNGFMRFFTFDVTFHEAFKEWEPQE